MDSKLSTLKAAAAAGDWQKAVAIAARFPQLGAERAAILNAHAAFTNPRFCRQVRRCPEADIAAGRAALIAKYRLA
jgi:hypothetical protein